MLFRRAFLPLLAALSLLAAPPTPKEHFGFDPGDDFKLANHAAIVSYFQKLEKESNRFRLMEFGRSSDGRPMMVAFISSPANLRQLDKWKAQNQRLALGRATAEEASKLAAEGKAIVWIDSGLHASEVAPAQHAPHLAYKMATGESAEIRRILDNVILMQVPVINPDGLDWVAEWYGRNVGTPHEIAAMPKLYQKYAGHDNNRDYFMLNLAETRHVTKMLFQEWFPQIVYNQHQQGPNGARFTIPPHSEPVNPYIQPAVMQGIGLIGLTMHERLAREGKGGVQSYSTYDAWWNGGLRSVPAFHNMHGILTEAALYAYATPKVFKPGELQERLTTGVPAREPSIFQPIPWPGGRWGTRESIDYMLTADFALLDLAVQRREDFLLKSWQMARANIDAGKAKPFAYAVRADQADSSAAVEFLWRLKEAGVDVRTAASGFQAGGKQYPAGTYVLYAAQPFRGYLLDMMEPQKYPEIRTGSGATKRPYDLAGWTPRMQMGVEADRIEEAFEAATEPAGALDWKEASLDARQTLAYRNVAELLAAGRKVRRAGDGRFLAEGQSSAEEWAQGKWELTPPRIALYESWTANMDTGWTEWMLDHFRLPHAKLHNDEVRRGGLRAKYDAIVLASQSQASILHGTREGETGGGRTEGASNNLQRPEYTGGIGLEGANELLKFVREGGTLLVFDAATELPLDLFPVGVRGVLRGTGGEWYCPGSVLRITVDDKHPLGWGMPKDGYATMTGGQAFEIALRQEFNKGDRETKAVSWYAKKDLLASGWVSGERAVTGRAAVVESRVGEGRVVLYGFRPQFRGQSWGTFKLVLNALYLAASKPL